MTLLVCVLGLLINLAGIVWLARRQNTPRGVLSKDDPVVVEACDKQPARLHPQDFRLGLPWSKYRNSQTWWEGYTAGVQHVCERIDNAPEYKHQYKDVNYRQAARRLLDACSVCGQACYFCNKQLTVVGPTDEDGGPHDEYECAPPDGYVEACPCEDCEELNDEYAGDVITYHVKDSHE